MCLITSKAKPFVAKKDIVCFKQLIRGLNETFQTPYQGIPVVLNTMLKAEGFEKKRQEFSEKYYIYAGFIHAYTGFYRYKYCDEWYTAKAIIPKGTEYYISDDFTEICAREMFITDEEVFSKEEQSPIDFIRNELDINDVIDPLVVSPGWYRLFTGKYLHPSALTEDDKKNVIGIVAYLHEDKIGVMGLNFFTSPWGEPVVNICSEQYEDIFEARRDYNGERHTHDVLNHEIYSSEKYPAFSWVNEYHTKGTKHGDWYFPAGGEVYEMVVENMFKVNAALDLLGVPIIQGHHFFASSTENSPVGAFGVYADGVSLIVSKGAMMLICPFLRQPVPETVINP